MVDRFQQNIRKNSGSQQQTHQQQSYKNSLFHTLKQAQPEPLVLQKTPAALYFSISSVTNRAICRQQDFEHQ
jgi:hypothetical protein